MKPRLLKAFRIFQLVVIVGFWGGALYLAAIGLLFLVTEGHIPRL